MLQCQRKHKTEPALPFSVGLDFSRQVLRAAVVGWIAQVHHVPVAPMLTGKCLHVSHNIWACFPVCRRGGEERPAPARGEAAAVRAPGAGQGPVHLQVACPHRAEACPHWAPGPRLLAYVCTVLTSYGLTNPHRQAIHASCSGCLRSLTKQ